MLFFVVQASSHLLDKEETILDAPTLHKSTPCHSNILGQKRGQMVSRQFCNRHSKATYKSYGFEIFHKDNIDLFGEEE